MSIAMALAVYLLVGMALAEPVYRYSRRSPLLKTMNATQYFVIATSWVVIVPLAFFKAWSTKP